MHPFLKKKKKKKEEEKKKEKKQSWMQIIQDVSKWSK